MKKLFTLALFVAVALSTNMEAAFRRSSPRRHVSVHTHLNVRVPVRAKPRRVRTVRVVKHVPVRTVRVIEEYEVPVHRCRPRLNVGFGFGFQAPRCGFSFGLGF